MTRIAGILASALIIAALSASPAVAERATMPQGALICRAIEPAIEHARIVRQPTTAGLREFVEAQVASGACRVVRTEVTIVVVDVDRRGYALVEDGPNGRGWTDAENVWGYFNAPAKVKAWKKP